MKMVDSFDSTLNLIKVALFNTMCWHFYHFNKKINFEANSSTKSIWKIDFSQQQQQQIKKKKQSF